MVQIDLASRWKTPQGEQLALEVLRRVRDRRSLTGLGLESHDGRLDLRGLPSPRPRSSGHTEHKGWEIEKLDSPFTLERVELKDLDFRGAWLESWRLLKSSITNCRFDDAQCRDWRLWSVDVSDSSFAAADMRSAVLGAWHEGKGNTFNRVDFRRADLREIVCPAATFVDCDFSNARLANVDFQSTSFVRCRFAGLLREVIFYARGFNTGKPNPNPMEDVDFSQAELRMVEFRGLDLDQVALPEDENHLVLRHYRCVLEHALEGLRDDTKWRGLRAIFENAHRWAGPRQEVGVFNQLDFIEMANADEAGFAADLLRRCEEECGAIDQRT